MDPQYKALYKIILIGETQTGKTTFLYQLCKGQLPKVIAPTIGVEFATKKYETKNQDIVKLQIWDMAGQEKYKAIARAHYSKSVGAIIFFDVTRENTFQAIPTMIQEVRRCSERNCLILIVGNKIDLVQNKPQARQVSEDVARSMASEQHCLYMEISSQNNYNVKESCELLVECISKIQNL